ncbi:MULTISPECIES: anti-sigma factor family protein [unclassified Shinella]|jgi:anti-sigma factor RsiW|uniref:anti-sigma factor family protein n=1 Tax=unclassified Shinella TaxID=2643062 RepID=UPI00234E70BA|nr:MULTISPECIES: anti-sigma factor [unclassified Shinella]MCO5150995.1 anti-sigma factor [Shinella sp.]
MVESTQGLPLEVRLSAYLDGQLPEAEMDEINAILAEDDDARIVFEKLKLGSDFGARAFDKLLQEPIPLDLVRNIKEAGKKDEEPPKAGFAAIPVAVAAPRRPSAVWPKALAASLVLFLAGGAAGYLVGERQDGMSELASTQFAPARTWLDDIADYHRIYARQTRHLVEVPASDKEHIVEWLSASTGVPFKLPDLSDQNLTFEGARLLVAGGKPAAQLLYRNAQNEVFAICFVQSDPVETVTALTESMRNDIGLVSWQKGSASYVVVGPSADPALERIAEAVSSTI